MAESLVPQVDNPADKEKSGYCSKNQGGVILFPKSWQKQRKEQTVVYSREGKQPGSRPK